MEALYADFLASTLRVVEETHEVHRQLQAHARRWPLWWESLDTLRGMLELRGDLADAWEVGNLQRCLAQLHEVAPFSRPSRGAFRCLQGSARSHPSWPQLTWPPRYAPRWLRTKSASGTTSRFGS